MNSELPGILFIHRNTHARHYGGIERKIISIITEFQERRLFRCHLQTNYADSPLGTGASSAGACVHVSNMDGILGLVRSVHDARRLVDQYNIDLVQSHMFWGSLVGGGVRRLCPQVRHFFRIHTHIKGSSIALIKRRAYHVLDFLNSPNVDHYCALSMALRRELTLSSGISESRISVLLNGINAPGPGHRIQDDEKPLPPRIAVVGDLQPRKRQDLVVEAIAILKNRGRRVECRFIGLDRFAYGEELRALACRMGVIDQLEFVGFQDPVHPWLEGIEVMVLQSDFEGVPTCMMEAMALNMLAISSDVGGTSELIVSKENGYLLRPGDPADLATCLESVFESPSTRLAPLRRKGSETFLTRCSLDAMIRGLMEQYRLLGIHIRQDRENSH